MNNGFNNCGASIRLMGMAFVGSALALGCGARPGDQSGAGVTVSTQGLMGNVFALVSTRFAPDIVVDPRNTVGARNIVVRHDGQGQFNVLLPGLGSVAEVGNVQVTALGNSNTLCSILNWGADGADAIEVNLDCFTPAGNFVDSLFTLSFMSEVDPVEGGPTAYLTVAADGTPSKLFNNSGEGAAVERTDTGAYTIFLEGQSMSSGTIEVTGIENMEAPEGVRTYCEIESWFDTTAFVRCFTPGGTNPDGTPVARGPIDSGFTLSLGIGRPDGTGLGVLGSPNGAPSFAYAWADQPTAASYTPFADYQFGGIITPECCTETIEPITISHSPTQTGLYSVIFPSLSSASPSNVKVTAYGSGGEYCKVDSWNPTASGGSATAQIRCFDSLGNAADSFFTVTYSSSFVHLP